MPNHSILLYVEDPLKSAEFYEKLLRTKPIDASPGFAMFALNDATMLGLWKRTDVLPKVTAPTGSNEVGFHVESNTIVGEFFRSRENDWRNSFASTNPNGFRLHFHSSRP